MRLYRLPILGIKMRADREISSTSGPSVSTSIPNVISSKPYSKLFELNVAELPLAPIIPIDTVCQGNSQQYVVVTIVRIIIVLIDSKENFCSSKEGFVPKIKVWRPATFTAPCQVDLDRQIKLKSERATLSSTQQLDQHTNGGFKVEQKQLY